MFAVADWTLRIGVAFSFLYPPLHAVFVDPYTWLGYVPQFALDMGAMVGLSDVAFLHVFGVFEVVVALWILSGWKIVWPSVFAAAALVAIVVVNPSQFEILFRDLSIAAAALALAALYSNRS